MENKHNHSGCCKHEEIKFCSKCKAVYCVKCGREWYDKCGKLHMDWTSGTTTYVYPTQDTFSITTNQPIVDKAKVYTRYDLAEDCNHDEEYDTIKTEN